MKTFFKWALILVALYLVYIIGFVYFTSAIPMHPAPLATAPQGIVVFTGTRARLQEGFNLLRRHPSAYLLISGVNEGTEKSYLMEVTKIPCCPPKDHVTLDYVAQDTTQNAIETARWAKRMKFDDLCLITSNYHMPRSLLELSHYAPELKIIPHPVVAKSFQNSTWWKDKKMLGTVFGEYNKFLWAWVRFKFESLTA